MIELPLIFVAGLLGSSHCIGMCGGFALAIGSNPAPWKTNLIRQLAYSAGRIFTYATLGAVVGFGALRAAEVVPSLINVSAILAIAAGSLLIYQGLLSTGLLTRRAISGTGSPCLHGTFLSTFLTAPGWHHALLAGVFTGMLPCGLLYGMLALAGSTRSVLSGMLMMTAFGLGTVPVMVLTGYGGSMMALSTRKRVFQVAAWCVVLTGAVSVARGLGFVSASGFVESTASCPLCP